MRSLVGLGRRASLPIALLAVSGCGEHVASPPLPTEAEWIASRDALAALRATVPDGPFGAVVQVHLREPRTGQTFAARGAVAVDPHRALRLILLGPGGATALDVWTTPDRWRFEVPAANVLRRGGRTADPNLPIGFFRWWFLAPLEGRLLTSVATPLGSRFIVRNETATVDLLDRHVQGGHVLSASRREPGREGEAHLAFEGAGFVPKAGDRAVYDDAASGVHVEVLVESRSDAPDRLAFADPDVAVSTTERAP